ncbi:MAG: glycoside hydrolase family 2 protein, partial [bacterium]|nr:glycoside hydrolase family 2 protein [bacterium]
EWTVGRRGVAQEHPALVPGDIYADLLRAGAIPDPFYRDNENGLQWIGESDWIYRREFDVPADLLAHEQVLLRCEGLDTFGYVRLNGKLLATTDNMFRAWEWPVKGLLRPGRNRIEIEFVSTIPYIDRRQAERPIPWWGQARSKEKVACHGWVRKEQCNYGWDWGIKAVACGIWRPIRLVAFSTARLADVRVEQDHSRPGVVGVTVRVAAEAAGAREGAALAARVKVARAGRMIVAGEASLAAGESAIALDIQKPELWWPNNLGTQPLYDVTVELVSAPPGGAEGGAVLDAASRRIGLRTLRLDRHPDPWGESFQFAVNGVPFFAKGANWIPADGILARMTPARYRRLVEAAAAANMNMLRVWGGGIYEDDSFYEACDELGICVWQDFMFACSSYPTFDEAFMTTVAAEARDNIRRLRHHPCLALWCGNNELEQGLVGPAWTDRQMSWEDYGKLFDKLLPELVGALDPQRDYWPASPHSPVGDRADFNNPACGDAHLWSVWHGRQPFEWYRTCGHRFNSEFGFQSFPEPKTVRGYTAPADRNVTSWVMEHHQRSGIGNTAIMQYMLDWFRLPEGFENTLWASQILQGMAIKYAVEHWRRTMPRGMGTIYWQINDTWPVASWSSIDYHGRWKALHYMARRFFAPLLASAVEDAKTGTVEVHVTSDLARPTAGRLRWVVTDLAGVELAAGEKAVRAAPRADRKVETLRLAKLLAEHGPRGLLVWLDLEAGGQPPSTNLALFARPKHLELDTRPGISMAVKALPEGNKGDAFAVTLRARRPALWCWLELEGVDAAFSDNFIHLRPGASVTIAVRPERPMTAAALRKRLRPRSLVDTYATG